MNTLTEAQKQAIATYTMDIANRAVEFVLAFTAAQPTAGSPTAEGVIAVAPRKRGRPRKHPLPVQGK